MNGNMLEEKALPLYNGNEKKNVYESVYVNLGIAVWVHDLCLFIILLASLTVSFHYIPPELRVEGLVPDHLSLNGPSATE